MAIAATLKEAYAKALACDPESAFGGVIALNRSLDADAAREIVEIFTEVIIAPDASDEAKSIVAGKKNLRLLLAGGLPDPKAPGLTFRSLSGGFLVQARDNGVAEADLKIVTKRTPTAAELADLIFAFTVAKHVKSNAIVYAKDGATVGIGAGQMSRIDSARMAAWKGEQAAKAAGLKTRLTEGSVAASDAFFPFPDGLQAIAEAGATAVIQPGGAMRDAEVIAAADEAGTRHGVHRHAPLPALALVRLLHPSHTLQQQQSRDQKQHARADAEALAASRGGNRADGERGGEGGDLAGEREEAEELRGLLGRAEPRQERAARRLDRPRGKPDEDGEGEIDLLANRGERRAARRLGLDGMNEQHMGLVDRKHADRGENEQAKAPSRSRASSRGDRRACRQAPRRWCRRG